VSRFSGAELLEAAERVSIYARLDPGQKLSIVKALQSQGHIVAVTGDGVNDAPCLKTADLGIAMGEGGTDVARETAGIVLRDNSFASIVAAIREGRVIFSNIQRFARYLFISNSGELVVLIVGPLLGLPMPLTPLQILWINLVTDGLPALALGVAPPERDVMTRPPRKPGQEIVDSAMARSIILNGVVLGSVSLAGGLVSRYLWPTHWQTVIFLVLVFSQLLLALALHSDTAPLIGGKVSSNKAIASAVLLCGLLQFATVQWEPLRTALHTDVLSGPEIMMCIGFSAIPLLGIEIFKWKTPSQLLSSGGSAGGSDL
jgi:P-type Ca2+ transporter type 2C